MALMSSCPSQSMEMVTSQSLALASISPASTAFWWPRFRLWEMPMKCSSSFANRQMSSQVESREPSLTKSTRLLSLTRPFSASDWSFCKNIGAVMGRTFSSL